jgi:hypothetical protein
MIRREHTFSVKVQLGVNVWISAETETKMRQLVAEKRRELIAELQNSIDDGLNINGYDVGANIVTKLPRVVDTYER